MMNADVGSGVTRPGGEGFGSIGADGPPPLRWLSPTWVSLAAVLAGQRPPAVTSPLRIADLCSRGAPLAEIVAAVHPYAEVWSVKTDASDAERSQRLAATAGLDNLVINEVRAGRQWSHDLGLFDIIMLTDISTVGAEQRAAIADFVAQHLRAGGLVVVSFRTLARWAELQPLRRMALLLAAQAYGDRAARVDKVVAMLDRLLHDGTGFIEQRPHVQSALAAMFEGDRGRVEELLLTDHLEPMSLAMVADWLAPAGASFVGSARPGDAVGEGLDQPLVELLADTPDLRLREMLRDLAAQRAYRVDVFRRGVAPLADAERRSGLEALALIGLDDADNPVADGRCSSSSDVRLDEVVADAMSRLRTGPATVRELLDGSAGPVEPDAFVIRLLSEDRAHPRVSGWAGPEARHRARALNRAIVTESSATTWDEIAAAELGSTVRATPARRAVIVGAQETNSEVGGAGNDFLSRVGAL